MTARAFELSRWRDGRCGIGRPLAAMNTNEIVQQLRAEKDKLDAAIQALEGVGGGESAPTMRRGDLLEVPTNQQPVDRGKNAPCLPLREGVYPR